jgi:hypothetical protein
MSTTKHKEISKDAGTVIDHWNAAIKIKTGKTLNLEINKEAVIEEVLNIETNFKSNMEEFKKKGKKIKNVIVGEATQSLENFIYNADGIPDNVFLANNLLNKDEKAMNAKIRGEILRTNLQDKGILILDLYLLPLPSFIYNDYRPKKRKDKKAWEACLKIYEKNWEIKLSGFQFDNEINVYVGFRKLRKHAVFTEFLKWIQEFFENKGIELKGTEGSNKDVPYYGDHTEELFRQNKSG